MGKDFSSKEQETLERMQKENIKHTIWNLETYMDEDCKYVRSILSSLENSLILYDLPSKVLCERVKFVMSGIPDINCAFLLVTGASAQLRILIAELEAYIRE